MQTRIVKIRPGPLGAFSPVGSLETWVPVSATSTPAIADLESAATYLTTSDCPVAFPTETVYGLGADATRSPAVRGIYSAKGRPSDNPLISHIADLTMLRDLLDPSGSWRANANTDTNFDPIPAVYRPLIERFWPGPLTILLPNATDSQLAPEVTAGLATWGVRMPQTPLALSLIKLAGVPLAAPSANASTKPSPTTARHVLDDLDGRIELIIDGGACSVGVESTVVDGLSNPPAILRPGGVSIDEIRECPGWENVVVGYKDHSEVGKATPRAPGMKYKHYSPKARVVLYESSAVDARSGVVTSHMEAALANRGDIKIGVIRTQRWSQAGGIKTGELSVTPKLQGYEDEDESFVVLQGNLLTEDETLQGTVFDVDLSKDMKVIAQGLFSALRALDRRGADVIFVDGVVDDLDIGGAVMNRLRKAASEIHA
ncbi:trna threonylcarbamoyladenosine biosynthesis protein [Ceratocystis lukuohia]|uniref:Threonylcarbamoyl-AMP synthase n=2 Tax=Ceratocystis TaxID=5157 RepID=A0A2C5WVU9_9PEZI|nr:Threonylcarbamoyl-AMP synthase [Ceratocystis fimbriata CBS 114723]